MWIIYTSVYARQFFGCPDNMWSFIERVMGEGCPMASIVIRYVPQKQEAMHA
jgi:hypothetical protein